MTADAEIEKVFPALQRVIVRIHTIDGREFMQQLDYPKGDPRNPLTDTEIEEKFEALAEPVMSRRGSSPRHRRHLEPGEAGERERTDEAVQGGSRLCNREQMMAQTIVEKIAQSHMAEGPNRPLRAGDFLSIRPDHVMTHDNTSAVMKKFKAIGARRVHDPAQPVFTADHDIQNTEESNLAKYRSMETFAREHGIDFYPPGTGIGHQIMVEKGYVLPGTFVVASDSHSNMYGALGAIGTPVVRTDAAAIWATGEFWWQIPRTIQVVLEGKLAPGVTGKDVIITLCGLYNREEVLERRGRVRRSGRGVAQHGRAPDASPTCPPNGARWWAGSRWTRSRWLILEARESRAASLRHHAYTGREVRGVADQSSRSRCRRGLCRAHRCSISPRSRRTFPGRTPCR